MAVTFEGYERRVEKINKCLADNGIASLEDGLAGKDLGGHGGGVGHARAADGLDEGLLDDALLDVKRKLAGTLLRGAPTHTVREARDVGNLLGLDPLALLGDGCGAVIRALGDGAHILDFCGILHVMLLSRTMSLGRLLRL